MKFYVIKNKIFFLFNLKFLEISELFLYLLLSFFSLQTFLLILNFCYCAVKSKQMHRQHSECLFLVSAV